MADTMILSIEQIHNIVYKAFLRVGLSEREADYAAQVLSMAELRGIPSHGLNRLQIYIKRFGTGVSNKDAQLEILNETACSYSFDAQNGLGIVMAPQAMAMVVEKAKKNGMCMAVMRNSGHYGIAGYYSLMAAEQGLIGMTISDCVQCMVPFGGRESVLGNSPWSVAFPPTRAGDDPVMLDMASSEVAIGKLRMAQIAGKKMPLTWAMGSDGCPTDDPVDALKTMALLPFGGPKGYCVALMWELMTTALSAGHREKDIRKNAVENEHNSHFFLAVDPAIFNPVEDINAVANEILDSVKNSEPAKGFSGVMLPGEIEFRNMHANREKGIAVSMKIAEGLLATLKESGVLEEKATLDDMINM